MLTRNVSTSNTTKDVSYGQGTNLASVTRYIVGYKKEESDFLLKFLYDHIALSQDLQCRVRWRPGTVVVWDVSNISPFRSRWKDAD